MNVPQAKKKQEIDYSRKRARTNETEDCASSILLYNESSGGEKQKKENEMKLFLNAPFNTTHNFI